MKHAAPLVTAAACAASLLGCGGDSPLLDPLSGGETTVIDTTRDAFSRPLANLSQPRREKFVTGNSFFNTSWVIAPASAVAVDGLGPLFNATACSNCHFKDGRGRPPLDDSEALLSMLVRISLPGMDAHGGPLDEPRYGGQLQGKAIPGVQPEATVHVDYAELAGAFDDGTPYTLRRPTLRIEEPAYGPLPAELLFSPRVAPGNYGLGLLEVVDEATLTALADPDDRDGDGISGRTNRVWDARAQQTALGRFGWKANQPTLEQQTAGAFLGDQGITSSLFPNANCGSVAVDCQTATPGGAPEISDEILGWTVYYGRTLAVPARRDVDDPRVVRGAAQFGAQGCGDCHTPTLHTGVSAEFPELSHQTIHPYSDLLLHDLGDGLADGRPDFLADGREWRTPPLWGLGLVPKVNEHTLFLHDGRARNLTEAILWHGGEAESAKQRFVRASAAARADLISFLESL